MKQNQLPVRMCHYILETCIIEGVHMILKDFFYTPTMLGPSGS